LLGRIEMSTFTLEPELGVAYFKFSESKIDRTVELNPDLNIDLDVDGKPVGIEFLRSSPTVPFDRLRDEFAFKLSELELIRRVLPTI
jgi:uncharacterized protein YuzE